MTHLVSSLLIVGLMFVGCRTVVEVADPVRMTPDGEPATLVSISFPGRGAALVEPSLVNNKVSVTVCTDGEDNWGAVLYGFFSLGWIVDSVASVFGGVQSDKEPEREVYGFGGCDQLFHNGVSSAEVQSDE